MKHIYLFCLSHAVLFCFSVVVSAQNNPRAAFFGSQETLPGMRAINRPPGKAQKTTASFARLTASYNGNGLSTGTYQNHDSSTYTYSSTLHHGFDLMGNVPQVLVNGTIVDGDFDTATNWLWSAASGDYKPNFRIINSYDVQDRPWQNFYQGWMGTNWITNSRSTTWYNTAGLDSFALGETWSSTTSSWLGMDRYYYTYDGAGNLSVETTQYWDAVSATWKNNSRDSMGYDSHGDMTYQLQQQWSDFHNNWIKGSQAFFYYSATFKQTSVISQNYDTLSSSWKNFYHTTTYYNLADQVIGTTTQNGNGATWTNADSSAYTLLNSSGQPLSSLQYHWTTGAWQPSYRTTSTVSAGGQQIVALTEAWNGSTYTNSFRSTSFYNTFNKPTGIFTEHWNGSAWIINTADQSKRYYYDVISTAVAATNTQALEAYVYPVPAGDHITVAAHLQRPQTCEGVVVDALGRTVFHWSDRAGTFYTKEIPVGTLAAGVYAIRLSDGDGSWSQSFVVTH